MTDDERLRAAAKRVYLKYGATTDWTEWRELAEALGLDWRAEEARAGVEEAVDQPKSEE